ncbi:hypothetical protein Lal_00039595 [Lupinus albus]|nr:hypothetical protein Lal_00039595 [Lupinus albus]
MASSSKRPRTSKSKQGESTSKSNPLNLTRLLANDAQRKVFEENFHGRAIFTPKYEDIERRKQQSLGETVKNKDILSAGYLTLEDGLVHYFLTYVILPKFLNHSQISDIELQLRYAIKFNIKINWTKMIMQQMWHVRGSQSSLPYAIFITKILEHFGVPLEGENKVALNLCEIKVDIEVVHKMGFVIDPVTRRTYKHRTDHQPAPTDEPEPIVEPNQPESHAPSSSSAAMPTNQMIMDELVSLRGYITTRMDAFDTQSQQIHYELHCLSSRLSNMDVDEDSSEPEHITPKERGRNTCIHIRGADSRQVKDISSSMLLSENYTITITRGIMSWKSRLSERFSPEGERITWEGEILGYTGRFSPEREFPRLGEKWQTGAVDTMRFSPERESLA